LVCWRAAWGDCIFFYRTAGLNKTCLLNLGELSHLRGHQKSFSNFPKSNQLSFHIS
jgi:hypothetical protein